MPGFDGNAPDLVLGSVTGVRWWHLRMPDFDSVRVSELSLTGVHASQPWGRGENTARCARMRVPFSQDRTPHEAPEASCGCGFWAYWTPPEKPNPHNFGVPVLGVIEGYGRTLIGDRGFRCARARITALHFTSDAATWSKDDPGTGPGYTSFRTEAAVATWEALCGRRDRRGYRQPDPEEAMARLTRLELMLEERYGVPVYASRSLMLNRHPPTGDYLPSGQRPGPPARPALLTAAEALARLEELRDTAPAAAQAGPAAQIQRALSYVQGHYAGGASSGRTAERRAIQDRRDA
jgi:hypothetical protein